MSLLRLIPRASLAARQPLRLGSLRTTRALSESEITSMLSSDLKLALRAKDKPRCTALRSLLGHLAEASKKSKPINSDAALYAIIQKDLKASAKAMDDFTKANRQDLVDKEKTEAAVLEEYLGKLDIVEYIEMDQIIAKAMEELKASGKPVEVNPLRSLVFAELEGRAVDNQLLMRKIEAAAPSK